MNKLHEFKKNMKNGNKANQVSQKQNDQLTQKLKI